MLQFSRATCKMQTLQVADHAVRLREDPGGHLFALLLIRLDLIAVAQRPTDIVQSLEQGLLAERINFEVDRASRGSRDGLGCQIHTQRIALISLDLREQLAHSFMGERNGQEAVIEAIVIEDIGEARRDEHAEAIVANGPGSVFARGAAAKVILGQQDRHALIAWQVQHEGWIGLRALRIGEAPIRKERALEAAAPDGFQKARRRNLVGIDVCAVQRQDLAGVCCKWFHIDLFLSYHSRISTKCPAQAAAAAIAGLTRWVRPPRPWRPSKLRLLVEAQRSPSESWSPFMAIHMLQPASRHWKPASRKMSARPSSSAIHRTCIEPGTTIARTLGATCLPLTYCAARRRSSRRELVQEPIKTVSSLMSVIFCPGCRPIYFSARSYALRFSGSLTLLGSGTVPVTSVTMPGLTPHVTWGPRPSILTSYTAS